MKIYRFLGTPRTIGIGSARVAANATTNADGSTTGSLPLDAKCNVDVSVSAISSESRFCWLTGVERTM